MTIADVTENNILKLIFNGTNWANVADNAAASPITQIAMALHTGDPGDSGTQASSESSYASYARQSRARSSVDWTAATTGSTALVNNCDYPPSGGASATITHFSAGKPGAAGSAADIYWSGPITPNIAISAAGVIPRLNAGSTISLD